MTFVYRHWFGLLISIFVIAFMLMLLLVALAPKQDAKSRGFIPCTQNMIEKLTDCNRKLWCSSKVILTNTWCDIKVIGKGLKIWAQGNQPRPWSNYIFEPEIPLDNAVDEEARQEYLKTYPDVAQEMERLHLLRKELENEQNNIETTQAPWNEESAAGMGFERPVSGN